MKLFIAYTNNSDTPLLAGIFSTGAKAKAALEGSQGEGTVEDWQVEEVELDHLLGDN